MNEETNYCCTAQEVFSGTEIRLHIDDVTRVGSHLSLDGRHQLSVEGQEVLVILPPSFDGQLIVGNRLVGRVDRNASRRFAMAEFLFDGHRLVLEYRAR